VDKQNREMSIAPHSAAEHSPGGGRHSAGFNGPRSSRGGVPRLDPARWHLRVGGSRSLGLPRWRRHSAPTLRASPVRHEKPTVALRASVRHRRAQRGCFAAHVGWIDPHAAAPCLLRNGCHPRPVNTGSIRASPWEGLSSLPPRPTSRGGQAMTNLRQGRPRGIEAIDYRRAGRHLAPVRRTPACRRAPRSGSVAIRPREDSPKLTSWPETESRSPA
jgi:hypothetical protein